MLVKAIIEEDFNHYQMPVLLICTTKCSGKCYTEGDIPPSVCHNSDLKNRLTLAIADKKIIKKYLSNPITSAVCLAGLEPFDQFEDVFNFISELRTAHKCDDTVVIYTGYNKNEIFPKINALKMFPNIIVKFGRYIPGQERHYDDVLGVRLASDNQYAEKIS
jgi:hypothetical protein